jgi:hypothetical protein
MPACTGASPASRGSIGIPASPQAYFTDLLTRLINSWPQKRIDDLMPWNFHRHTAH